jgi:hypothetical protein
MGVVSLGIGAASAVGQYMQANQAAKNQDKLYEQNKENSQQTFVNEQGQLQQKQEQEQQQEAQQSYEMSQEHQRDQAKEVNAAASNGQAGLSVESLLQDLDRQELDRQNAAHTNLEWTLEDLQNQKSASAHNELSNINSVQPGQYPSMGELALGIAGAGMNAYSTYSGAKLKVKQANVG